MYTNKKHRDSRDLIKVLPAKHLQSASQEARRSKAAYTALLHRLGEDLSDGHQRQLLALPHPTWHQRTLLCPLHARAITRGPTDPDHQARFDSNLAALEATAQVLALRDRSSK